MKINKKIIFCVVICVVLLFIFFNKSSQKEEFKLNIEPFRQIIDQEHRSQPKLDISDDIGEDRKDTDKLSDHLRNYEYTGFDNWPKEADRTGWWNEIQNGPSIYRPKQLFWPD